MKITYVTGTSMFGSAGCTTKTADVARQTDLKDAVASVDELAGKLAKLGKRLGALEKRVAVFEDSLANADSHLRDDCKDIFARLIEESLGPAFSVMNQLAAAKGAEAPSENGRRRAAEKMTKATRTTSLKNRGRGKC